MARDFLSTGLSPVAQAQEWKVGTSDPSSAGNWKGGEGVKGQEEADRHEGMVRVSRDAASPTGPLGAGFRKGLGVAETPRDPSHPARGGRRRAEAAPQ